MDREELTMNNETELNDATILTLSFELKKALEMIASDLKLETLIKISRDLGTSNIIVSNEIRNLDECLESVYA